MEQAYARPLGEGGDGRPWVWLCMVSSLDGSTVVDGASAGLSGDNDSAVLLRLRSIADVVLVGAGTANGEGYGPPSKVGQRIGVVTGRGSVDTTSDLFTSGAGFVITTETARFDEHGVDVLRCGVDRVDLADASRRLADVCGVADLVQVEGGPTLNGAFAAADLFDELDLNHSPATVGGDGPRLVVGGAGRSHRFELDQLTVDDESFVFTRWRRRRSSP